MSEHARLSASLDLPCGATLSNRIAKASMTEGLADEYDDATEGLDTLYGTWSDSGAGLLLTGNVMVDRRFLERPGNVVVDDETDLDALGRWAAAGTRNGNHLWMQISHPGRQCQRTSTSQPVAPSSVGLKLAGMFGRPRALEVDEIWDIINRFARTAGRAKDAGFTGVEIHSAHGYLGSQFLSPRVNRRTDEWGGTLENRARFLMETVAAVRDAVGDGFPVAVKLNSSDFQKGAFNNEDSAQVAAWLAEKKIDLLEISGGTYERVAFLGELDKRAESTRRREVYFLEYAKLIREAAGDTPLMLTGGFRTPTVMDEVVADGELDVVGIARPFCVQPDFPRRLLRGTVDELPSPERGRALGPGFLGPRSKNRTMRALNSQANTAWFYRQILHLADGAPADLDLGVRAALAAHMFDDQRKGFARKRHGRRA